MSTTIKSRRGTTAALTASDPTPARGEIIVEYDAAVSLDADVVSVRIGDGVRPWSELSPINQVLFTAPPSITGALAPADQTETNAVLDSIVSALSNSLGFSDNRA